MMRLSPILCASFVALALSSITAFAKVGEPIAGVPIGLEGDPGSIVIAHDVTDGEGNINFGKLAPGKYVAVIDGKSLVAAVDRLAPSAPAKNKSSESSSGAGVDRMGGGGGHSHSYKEKEGAGPTKDSHDNSASGGGGSPAASLSGTWSVSEGIEDRASASDHAGRNVAVGDVNGDGPPQSGSIVINLPWNAGDKFSTPYRRDNALREGVRIKFTVPPAPAGASTYDALGRIIFVGVTVKY